jgi:hypothetical protein
VPDKVRPQLCQCWRASSLIVLTVQTAALPSRQGFGETERGVIAAAFFKRREPTMFPIAGMWHQMSNGRL